MFVVFIREHMPNRNKNILNNLLNQLILNAVVVHFSTADEPEDEPPKKPEDEGPKEGKHVSQSKLIRPQQKSFSPEFSNMTLLKG